MSMDSAFNHRLRAKRAMIDLKPGPTNGPFKRSKRPPSSPQVPPSYVSFRLLCHASRIGGVIGKAGSTIKQLQQCTGAKIRIEEAPSESPDRVISILASNAISTKIVLDSSDDSGSEVEVSKGQDALVKVFERILEVAAESGVAVMTGVVSCRLLAEVTQVGSVIGKGGKMVEKIKKDTGTKIRVLMDNLPACASSTEEIVEIEGDVLAVKKALVSVSRCLQDCSLGNKTRMADSRYLEAVPQETLHRQVEVVPREMLHKSIDAVTQGTLRRPIEAVSMEALQRPIEAVTMEALRRPTEAVPMETLRRPVDTIPMETLRRPIEAVPMETLRRPIEGVPMEVLRRPIEAIPMETLRRPIEAVPMENLRRPIETVTQQTLHRHIAMAPQDSLPDMFVDRVSQRSSLASSMPSSSIISKVHLESERALTLETRTLEKEVVFKILCSKDRVGGVIGKGGAIIKNIQNETGASIVIGNTLADCDERLVTVTALENTGSRYSPAQKAVALIFVRSLEAGVEKGLDSSLGKRSNVTSRLVVPSNQVGCLLGKGGAIISEMRKVTGTAIQIFGTDEVPKCVTENDQVVQISGEYLNVKDAVYHVTGRLRDHLFSSALKSAGTSTSSLLTETSPYGRLLDSSPLELHSSASAAPHGLSQHSVDYLGFSHNLDHPLDHSGLSHDLDRSCSPSLWTSESVTGVYPLGLTDIGRGFTSRKGGLELGSGSKSAIVTNTTVEISVPENVIGSVYGENGRNISRLREISGAKVIIHEPRLGTTDRIIVISGTPDETQAAQSLLQAFILTGPT